MDHVAGLPSPTLQRMSPQALGLAVLLHVVAALVLWWMTLNRSTFPPLQDPVEITLELPKPPDPPPPPQQAQPAPKPEPKPEPKPQPTPQPAPVPLQGIAPPGETADRRTQVRPSGDQPKDIAGPPPRSLDEPLPQPQPQPPAPPVTAEPPPPKEPPPPPVEQAALQPPPPAPAVTSLPPPPKEPPPPPHEPVAPKPPPPAHVVTPAHPVPPPRPATPPAVTPHPQPHPTPQIARPQQHPPAIARREEPPSSSPFVNPADVRNRALVGDNYLWQIARKLSGYRFSTQGPVGEAHLVVRIVVARDGRLLAVDVVQSSGIAAVDQGALHGIRAGSPYTPLPPEIGGNSASFTLPLVSVPVGSRF